VTPPSALAAALARAIAPGRPIESGDGDGAIARDARLLDEMLASDGKASTVRLWVNRRCLVVPRAWAGRPGFDAASAAAADGGWPVHFRESGGSAVVHRPGILNVSLFHAAPADPLGIDEAYGRLVSLLVAALGALGVEADAGPVAGSYCDGRFNIRVGGRKLAGTACRIRRTTRRVAVLAHAVVSVEGDPAGDVAVVAAFERALGLPAAYRIDRHCTLEQVLAARLNSPEC